jgi:hypothetical protein
VLGFPFQRNWALLVCLLLAAPPLAAGNVQNVAVSSPRSPEAAYGQSSLSFEPNQGQAESSVDFVAHAQSYTVGLSAAEAVLHLGPDALHVHLRAAAPDPEMLRLDPLPGTVNYLVGNDPAQWHTGIPTYARVGYRAIYPGVDVVYYGAHGQLESDFVVSPGADPSAIRLSLQGADNVRLDESGQLVAQLPAGRIVQPAPSIYQDEPQGRRAVAGGYILDPAGDVGFSVGAYDSTRALIIDPVLVYSTYVGGAGLDYGNAIAVDGGGNAYVTGYTNSANFPTTRGALQPGFHSGVEAFVTKLNPTGTAAVYSTYLAGSSGPVGGSVGLAIAVDKAGSAYVSGFTSSADFPTTPGAFQSMLPPTGSAHAFVSKLNPAGGALVYSTFLAGNGDDFALTDMGLAVDNAGNAYVAGNTLSPEFPTTAGSLQPKYAGGGDGFVSKLNPSGTALVYSTFLGGSDQDAASGLALDAAGNAFVAGFTHSSNFPSTPGALQTRSGGVVDAFVSKLNPSGSALVYSTFLGGSDVDQGTSIAVDAAGSAFVTGYTASTNFPTLAGGFQRAFHGGFDAFVSKLNPSGSGMVYSTYLGGSSRDFANAIAVDRAGNAYVTGRTASANFPTTPGALQPDKHGDEAAFVSKLNAAGAGLAYSTYLAGSGPDSFGNAIALDIVANSYVTGGTSLLSVNGGSPPFPITPGAWQPTFGGGENDGFVTKFALGAPPLCELSGAGTTTTGQHFIRITAQDTVSGLRSVSVTEASNATVQVPVFTPGTLDPVAVTATKLDQTAGASVALRVTNQAGQFTDCDPGVVTVGRQPGESPVQVLHHLAHGESQVTIINGAPGVHTIRLVVNGRHFEVSNLQPDQTVNLDVSEAMRKRDTNTLRVVAVGPAGSSAVVIVSD